MKTQKRVRFLLPDETKLTSKKSKTELSKIVPLITLGDNGQLHPQRTHRDIIWHHDNPHTLTVELSKADPDYWQDDLWSAVEFLLSNAS